MGRRCGKIGLRRASSLPLLLLIAGLAALAVGVGAFVVAVVAADTDQVGRREGHGRGVVAVVVVLVGDEDVVYDGLHRTVRSSRSLARLECGRRGGRHRRR